MTGSCDPTNFWPDLTPQPPPPPPPKKKKSLLFNDEKPTYLFLFSFYFQSPCQSIPCQNNGDCVPDFKQNSYHCDCKAGFAGSSCERTGIKHLEYECVVPMFYESCVKLGLWLVQSGVISFGLMACWKSSKPPRRFLAAKTKACTVAKKCIAREIPPASQATRTRSSQGFIQTEKIVYFESKACLPRSRYDD